MTNSGNELREETVEWLGYNFIPEYEGHYYVKFISPNGKISKSTCTFEKGEWQLGSGHLAGIKVLEWMRDDSINKNKEQ